MKLERRSASGRPTDQVMISFFKLGKFDVFTAFKLLKNFIVHEYGRRYLSLNLLLNFKNVRCLMG